MVWQTWHILITKQYFEKKNYESNFFDCIYFVCVFLYYVQVNTKTYIDDKTNLKANEFHNKRILYNWLIWRGLKFGVFWRMPINAKLKIA